MADVRMQRAFTLIELIVVIAIIAILAAIIAPNAFRAIEKAKITRLLADIKTLKTAAMAYYADVGMWPPDVCPGDDPGFLQWDAYKSRSGGIGNVTPEQEQIIQSRWNGPYIEKFPQFHPWGGSYDWEYWPIVQWGMAPGCYVSARQRYDRNCAPIGNAEDTSVPDDIEIKLQQQGIDAHYSDVNVPDNIVIMNITQF